MPQNELREKRREILEKCFYTETSDEVCVYAMEFDDALNALQQLELQPLTRGCLLAREGRGDCEHFIGIPKEFKYPDTIDEYGRPHNWCEVCWSHYRIEELEKGEDV